MAGPQGSALYEDFVKVALHLLQYAHTVQDAATAYQLATWGLKRCGHRCDATGYANLGVCSVEGFVVTMHSTEGQPVLQTSELLHRQGVIDTASARCGDIAVPPAVH